MHATSRFLKDRNLASATRFALFYPGVLRHDRLRGCFSVLCTSIGWMAAVSKLPIRPQAIKGVFGTESLKPPKCNTQHIRRMLLDQRFHSL